MRRRDSGIGCGARGFASQAKTREAPGPRPGGTRTALRGARWTGTGSDSRESGGLVPGSADPGTSKRWRAAEERRDGAPAGASPRSQEDSPPQGGIQDESADRRSVPFGLTEGRKR